MLPDNPAIMDKQLTAIRPSQVKLSVLLHALSQLVLLACLVVVPWVYGGVQLNVQVTLCAGVMIAGCLCCWSVQSSGSPSESGGRLLPFVPFLMIVAIALLHLLPSRWQSVYPSATRVEVARLVMSAGIFATATVLFGSAKSRPVLWGLIAINGAALAFFGIAHKLRPDAGVFAYVPTHGGAPFASFVSKNSAAGYLNLCLAAGLGLLVWSRARVAGEIQHSASGVASAPRHNRKPGSITRRNDQVTRVTGMQLFALALIVTCLAGIFSSMARGATIAALGAGAITAFTVPRRSRLLTGLFCMIVGLLSFALIFWSGMIPQVESRLATLSGDELTQNGRWAHWADAMRAVSQSWFTGTGLGTYRYAYLPFQANEWEVWFHHAENQYIETLLECGIVGLTALLSIMALIAYHLRQLFQRGAASSSADVRVAGLFAFCSMSIQSLFDFPLVIPSNFLLFAVICGAVTGTAMVTSMAVPAKRWQLSVPRQYRFITVWATALFLAYGAFGFHEIKVAAAVQTAQENVPKSVDSFPDPDTLVDQMADVDQHIDTLTELATRKTDDAELHQQIADLWIASYRLHAFQQLTATQSGSEMDAARRAEIWKLTDPVVLYANANQAQQAGQMDVLVAMRENPLVKQNLIAATHHLQLALQSCSILPRVNLDLATLAFLHHALPDGADFLQRELYLSSASPGVLYSIGLSAWSGGLKDLACKAWSRSLSLNPHHLKDVIDLLVAQNVGIDEIIRALPDSPSPLVELAANRFSGDGHATERIALLGRARELLDGASSETRDEQWYCQYARLYATARNTDAAITAYRHAIELAPLQLETRLELSLLLQEQGRFGEAYEEARVCAALEPDRDDIKTLIRELLRKEQRGAGKG